MVPTSASEQQLARALQTLYASANRAAPPAARSALSELALDGLNGDQIWGASRFV